MIEGSPFSQRAASNGLRAYEQFMHDELMLERMQYWPESLQEFVGARVHKLGLCGDVVSVAVADWIAHRPLWPDPPARQLNGTNDWWHIPGAQP